MTRRTHDRTVARLHYLRRMLAQYAHRWTVGNVSSRMYGWVDEYSAAKNKNPEAWLVYCTLMGFDVRHDGYDCLA